MFYLKIIFLLLFSSTLFANIIDINEETKTLDILSKSEIYIDKNKNLTFEDIKNQNIKFEKITKIFYLMVILQLLMFGLNLL